MQKKRTLFLLLIFFIISITSLKSQLTSVESLCLDDQELQLAALINNFRVQNDLPPIALSRSLSYVAKTHVYDLQLNKQDTSICNAHSWSNKGKWKSCCFNSYVVNNNCMWDKPKELTPYIYRGYEMVFNEEGIVQVDSVFYIWKTAREAVDMLLSRNQHSDKKWLAMGVGVSENYVSVWFGQRPDPTEKLISCKEAMRNNLSNNESESSQQLNISGQTAKYYLIYGSFNTRSDAEEAVKRYKKSGLQQVSILQKDGRFRVAIDAHSNLKDAMKSKEKFHDQYPEAWIYKE